MTCEDARALLLEADPAELAGESEGPLAAHINECADCRAAADRVLAAEDGLAAALGASRSRRGASEAARRAMAAARDARRGVTWRRVAPWVPLAAAAALLLVLLRGDRQVPLPALPPPPASAALDVDVLAPGGRTAAVFRTADPDIVVVWFF